jgi:glycosyltransferase involved in cell wall biosynthesis
MSATPRLSVIVPAHRAAAVLPVTLRALGASTLPREAWELIVVDDGSDDAGATHRAAEPFADRVLRLAAPPGGPARARNAGAAVARATWLVFVDADVVVEPDALAEIERTIAAHPAIAACFGAYTTDVRDQPLVSRYRNLLHRYVHLQGAGPAETFWAGLGAVRREAFQAAGGFDAKRYPRPMIEDIELGYRLRERGETIRLEPRIGGRHLKRWTLAGIVRTDFSARAVPWGRLLLARRGRTTVSLNISRAEQLRAALVVAGLGGIGLAAVAASPRAGLAAATLLALGTVSNLRLYRWMARTAGPRVAVVAVPMQWWHYLASTVAMGVALLAPQDVSTREVLVG